MSCSVFDFGKALLRSGDLDPAYIMLTGAGLDSDLLKRWCLAYWCFYHAGTATRIVDGPSQSFHRRMRQACEERWPRGTERRHFRGRTSSEATEYLRSLGPPERIVDAMVRGGTFAEVSASVRAFPYFGPWIAFKVADMAERVLGLSVDFSDCELGIYREPARGAALVVAGDPDAEVDVGRVVRNLVRRFQKFKAPPALDRLVNMQEVETILCKYKSHVGGHYPIGKDTKEMREALSWYNSDLSHALVRALPCAS